MVQVRLGEVGKIITGNTPKTSDSKNYDAYDICFIKPSDIDDNELTDIHNSEYHISEYARSKARILPAQSVLVTCIGIIGKVGINAIECAFNQQINAIVPDTQKCDCRYLAYAIQYARPELQRIANAPVVPILNKSQFSDIKIFLPSLDEQRRIAATLDKVTDLISKRRQQLDKLDELVKARFVEMFGDPLCDNHKYQKVPLGTVANVGSSKRIFEKEYVSDGVPFYRTKEIVELAKGHKITTELYISKKRFNEICEEYGKPQKGDLLISAVGTIGVIWIVDGKNDFYFKDGNLLRVAFSNQFDPVYLRMLLEALITEYKKKMATGTAYAALTISILKEIPVYLVPLDEQKNFSAFVEQTEKVKATISRSLEKLETLKKALMQEYFGVI